MGLTDNVNDLLRMLTRKRLLCADCALAYFNKTREKNTINLPCFFVIWLVCMSSGFISNECLISKLKERLKCSKCQRYCYEQSALWRHCSPNHEPDARRRVVTVVARIKAIHTAQNVGSASLVITNVSNYRAARNFVFNKRILKETSVSFCLL